MKTFYEAPVAEVIDFAAKEQIAVIGEREAVDETVGREPEVGVGSRDF